MKKTLLSLIPVLFFGLASMAHAQEGGEDYKSFNPDIAFTAGAGAGFGKVNSQEGFAFVGNIAARILREGFVPDIVNPVYVELQAGPMVSEGESLWLYSTHLRWDFIKNSTWTFFGVGGIGGNFYDNDKFGSDFSIHPRFGIGGFWALDLFDVRADVSHEMILVGLSFPF